MERANTPEKVSVNMNSSTLAQIDLLVDQGYYSNRSDFINQAARETLARQQSTIDRIAAAHTREWSQSRPKLVGVYRIPRSDSEEQPPQDERTESRDYDQSRPWFMGVYGVTRRDLEEMLAQGVKMEIRGYGLLCFDADCDEALLRQTVASIQVRGHVRCAASVKALVDALRQNGANAD